MGFGDFIAKINDDKKYEKVYVDSGVIDSAVFYSKKSYPNEFLAMFDGYVEENALYITSLVFLPGERSHTSASFNEWLIPPTQKVMGSIHSHPGYNTAYPSDADLVTFAKHGTFHIIVCEPYSLETMRAYDAHGNPTTFEVGDFVDKHQEMMLEDLKELRDSIDENAEIKASFFDLEQDLSEFEDDEEKVNKYSHEFENPYSDDLGDSMDEDIGSRNDFLSNQILEINGERINGQAPNLGLIIEIKDGKPYIKDYVRRPISWDKDDEENQE